jgi:2-dehydro-3-deoxyphosphogluconate aldolase/(4S)-4-hydroxy-2-oxoglutarate aldolase
MDIILQKRLVPVAVIDNADDAVPLANALIAAGLPIIEVTFRTPAAESSIRKIASALPQVLIGAGTLLDIDQVIRAKSAGAHFGVAPGFNETVVSKAIEVGLPFIPGVATPSEVERALMLGCRLQKFFPADVAGGPKMLKALNGPYGHTGLKFIPLGGINATNMNEYLSLPNVAAVGGSWIVERKLIVNKNWSAITDLTRAALSIIAANATA